MHESGDESVATGRTASTRELVAIAIPVEQDVVTGDLVSGCKVSSRHLDVPQRALIVIIHDIDADRRWIARVVHEAPGEIDGATVQVAHRVHGRDGDLLLVPVDPDVSSIGASIVGDVTFDRSIDLVPRSEGLGGEQSESPRSPTHLDTRWRSDHGAVEIGLEVLG